MSRVWLISSRSAAGGSLGELLQTDANPEDRSAGAGGDRLGAGGELFGVLVVSRPRRARRGLGVGLSLAAHALAAGLLVLVPVLWAGPPPPPFRDAIRVLIYDPPPPPPPPPPKGSALVETLRPIKPTVPDSVSHEGQLIAPQEIARNPEAARPEVTAAGSQQAGSPLGSDLGVPEGMDGGVEEGVAGGVPGGVPGGVVGGTGDVPVRDYGRPPRLLRQVKPEYPQDAFVKKVEGIVLVEFMIDTTGRVAWARVVRSVPMLDGAAIRAVRQWIFSPAVRRGVPVATIAQAPVSFRIY